nr:MAG TPA_asm: hypothetical protein [Caudoviricetes sp.]
MAKGTSNSIVSSGGVIGIDRGTINVTSPQQGTLTIAHNLGVSPTRVLLIGNGINTAFYHAFIMDGANYFGSYDGDSNYYGLSMSGVSCSTQNRSWSISQATTTTVSFGSRAYHFYGFYYWFAIA